MIRKIILSFTIKRKISFKQEYSLKNFKKLLNPTQVFAKKISLSEMIPGKNPTPQTDYSFHQTRAVDY